MTTSTQLNSSMNWELAAKIRNALYGPTGAMAENKPFWEMALKREANPGVVLEPHQSGDAWSLPEPKHQADRQGNDWYLVITPPIELESKPVVIKQVSQRFVIHTSEDNETSGGSIDFVVETVTAIIAEENNQLAA